AWFGTVSLLALRFLHFLARRGGDAYQVTLTAEARRSPGLLLRNLKLQLQAGLSYLQTSGAALVHWRWAAWVLALVLVMVWLAVWCAPAAGPSRGRLSLVVLGLAALAVLLGSLPFIPLQGLPRTQYFVAPGRAVLMACLLCLAGDLLGRRAGWVLVGGCLGML